MDFQQQIEILTVVIGLIWAANWLLRSFELLYWWQTKEYRSDRLRDFESTKEGKKILTSFSRSLREGFVFAVLFFILSIHLLLFFLNDNQLEDSSLMDSAITTLISVMMLLALGMVFLWFYELALQLKKVSERGVIRPKLNGKSAILLSLITFGGIAYGLLPLFSFYPFQLISEGTLLWNLLAIPLTVLYLIPAYFIAYSGLVLFAGDLLPILLIICWVTLDYLLQPVTRALIFLLQPFTGLKVKKTVKQARAELTRHPELTIIGITGSYGKSSTKEMLTQLLQSKYPTVGSKANNNTLIGLAQLLAKGLPDGTKYLVAEMGAYTQHEIRDMCLLAPPHISVITGLNAQHLSLFGRTLEDTKRAKYEIVSYMRAAQQQQIDQQEPPSTLKENRITHHLPFPGNAERKPRVLMHADNEHLQQLLKKASNESFLKKHQIMPYSVKNRYQTSGLPTALLAMNVASTANGVEFQLLDNREARTSREKQPKVELEQETAYQSEADVKKKHDKKSSKVDETKEQQLKPSSKKKKNQKSSQASENNNRIEKKSSPSKKRENTTWQDLPKISLPVLGEHQVINFLAAATIALELGMTLEEIQIAAKKLELPDGNMKKLTGYQESVVIDDSYSTNPDGFLAALQVMNVQKNKRRIVITKGMQELGEESRKQHRRIGAAIAEQADILLLLSRDFELGLREGIGEKADSKLQTLVITDLKQALTYLKGNITSNDVILLEGRLPSNIVNFIHDQ